MKERWRDIPGYEGEYMVSSHGRVYSVERRVRLVAHGVETTRRVPPRFLKPGKINRFGHVSVALGKGNSQCVHTLVLLAFVGPRPTGMEACHLDTDATNNRLCNLAWGTKRENMLDCALNGKVDIPFTTVQYVRKSKLSGRELSKLLGISKAHISNIRLNRMRVHA